MKALRFLPLCFIADVHGFCLFAPYLVMFLFAVHLIMQRQRVKKRAMRAPIHGSERRVIPDLMPAIA